MVAVSLKKRGSISSWDKLIFWHESPSFPQPDTWRWPRCSTVCPSTWRSTRWRTLCPSRWRCERLALPRRRAPAGGGAWRVSSDASSTQSCSSLPAWPAECFVRSQRSSTTGEAWRCVVTWCPSCLCLRLKGSISWRKNKIFEIACRCQVRMGLPPRDLLLPCDQKRHQTQLLSVLLHALPHCRYS